MQDYLKPIVRDQHHNCLSKFIKRRWSASNFDSACETRDSTSVVNLINSSTYILFWRIHYRLHDRSWADAKAKNAGFPEGSFPFLNSRGLWFCKKEPFDTFCWQGTVKSAILLCWRIPGSRNSFRVVIVLSSELVCDHPAYVRFVSL